MAPLKKNEVSSDESSENEDVSEEEEALESNEEEDKNDEEVEEKDDDSDDDDEDDEDDDNDDDTVVQETKVQVKATELKRKHEKEKSVPKKKQKISNNEELRDENTIYVKNIPKEVTQKKFQKLFDEASSIRFPVKYDGECKGFAFLVFDKEKKMNECLSTKQGLEINGNKLHLSIAGDSKTMYVKGINRQVTEEELNKIFPEATNIRYPLTEHGKPKGFAFIQFTSEKQVKDIVSKRQGTFLKGDKMYLDSVSNRKKNPQTFRAYGDIKQDGYSVSEEPTKTITVRNLSFSLTEDDLIQKLSADSAVLISQPDTGRSKGRAYVNFKNKRGAKDAMKKFNEETIQGRKVYIYYAKKQGKSVNSGTKSADKKQGGKVAQQNAGNNLHKKIVSQMLYGNSGQDEEDYESD